MIEKNFSHPTSYNIAFGVSVARYKSRQWLFVEWLPRSCISALCDCGTPSVMTRSSKSNCATFESHSRYLNG